MLFLIKDENNLIQKFIYLLFFFILNIEVRILKLLFIIIFFLLTTTQPSRLDIDFEYIIKKEKETNLTILSISISSNTPGLTLHHEDKQSWVIGWFVAAQGWWPWATYIKDKPPMVKAVSPESLELPNEIFSYIRLDRTPSILKGRSSSLYNAFQGSRTSDLRLSPLDLV